MAIVSLEYSIQFYMLLPTTQNVVIKIFENQINLSRKSLMYTILKLMGIIAYACTISMEHL